MPMRRAHGARAQQEQRDKGQNRRFAPGPGTQRDERPGRDPGDESGDQQRGRAPAPVPSATPSRVVLPDMNETK
jgi:hypothetical protein